MDINELLEKRMKLVAENRAILDRAKAENRSTTAEEKAEWDAREVDIEAMTGKIAEIEGDNAREARQQEREAKLQESRGRKAGISVDPASATQAATNPRSTPEYHAGFSAFLKRGTAGIPQQFRTHLQVDSDSAGGYLSASERFLSGVLQSVDDAVAIRALATVLPAMYGENLGQVTLAGDVGDFSWEAGENTTAETDTTLAFGLRELKIHPLKRKLIKVSKRLIESARVDAAGVVQSRAGYALARTLERAYMTGTGAGQPLGLFVASDSGISTARDVSSGNTTTSIGMDGLINCIGALKQQYLMNARWLFPRDAITQIRKLKDGNGRYLWEPSTQVGKPDQILGREYIVSEFAPNTFTTGQYVGLLGDFSFYWIADAVQNMAVQVMLETYAPEGRVGYLFDKIGADAMPVLGEAFARVKLA